MWSMLVLLWAIPVATILYLLAPAPRDQKLGKETGWTAFFPDTRPLRVTPWMLIQFIILLPLFFACGLFEALVISNFGAAWALLAPAITGAVALLLVGFWMKAGQRRQAARRRTEPIDLTDTVVLDDAGVADTERAQPAGRILRQAILRRRRILSSLRNRLPF